MSSARFDTATAVEAIDAALIDCAAYISRHANGEVKYGWEWCAEAARVANALAVARAAVVGSMPTFRISDLDASPSDAEIAAAREEATRS
jgi:hypothetical protein